MTATPAVQLAPAAFNIGKQLGEGITGWFLDLWDKIPYTHWPHWIWWGYVGVLFVYIVYWLWFNFLR